LKKSLQDYALAAEIIGAIAVVISLIYVGASVNQNTKAIMVSNHQALVTMDMDKNDWLRDSGFAAIYEIGLEDTSKLSPVQLMQFSTFVANTFNAWEFAFGKPLVSYTPESVTITQSEEYRYERKTLSRRI